MIYSEGYKAFRGTMRIVPKNSNTKPYELTADWLYKPEYQCWYGRSSSFPEEICEVLADLTTPPANPPLTPDQLREMDGEPVWIEWGGHPQAGWALVRVWSKANDVIYLTYHNGNMELLGYVLADGVKIYRRKAEGGAI